MYQVVSWWLMFIYNVPQGLSVFGERQKSRHWQTNCNIKYYSKIERFQSIKIQHLPTHDSPLARDIIYKCTLKYIFYSSYLTGGLLLWPHGQRDGHTSERLYLQFPPHSNTSFYQQLSFISMLDAFYWDTIHTQNLLRLHNTDVLIALAILNKNPPCCVSSIHT